MHGFHNKAPQLSAPQEREVPGECTENDTKVGTIKAD